MPNRIARELRLQGARCSIYEIAQGDRRPVSAFIEDLPIADQAKVTRLFKQMAEAGEIRNEEKFVHEEDGIFAFKSFKVRIYCFFDSGKLLLLTHGVIKKQRKARPQDIRHAKDIRDAYLEAKKKGEIR